MRKLFLVPAALTAAALAALIPAVASPGGGSIDDTHATRWSGTVPGASLVACAPLDPACDHFAVTVPETARPTEQVVVVSVGKRREVPVGSASTTSNAAASPGLPAITSTTETPSTTAPAGTTATCDRAYQVVVYRLGEDGHAAVSLPSGRTTIVGRPLSTDPIVAAADGGHVVFPATPGVYDIVVARAVSAGAAGAAHEVDYDAIAGVTAGELDWNVC
jgi:hypothetical protein